MAVIALKAHFDGQHITLDEPYQLNTGTKLIVTVQPPQVDEEAAEWSQLSAEGLERAYGTDEPEYTAEDVIR